VLPLRLVEHGSRLGDGLLAPGVFLVAGDLFLSALRSCRRSFRTIAALWAALSSTLPDSFVGFPLTEKS
jgi:hypothetical protein